MRRSPGPICLLAALAVTFFGILVFCAAHYPGDYDWRHTVMSSLASPRQNPAYFRVASYGIAVSGILLSVLAFHVRQTLRFHAPGWTGWGCFFFVLGGVLLTVSALVTPGHYTLLGLGKAHAKIAQAAGIALGTGMALDLPALLRLRARYAWLRVSALILIVVPMSAFLLCRIFLPMVEQAAPPAARSAIHHSILGSLAFWEWVGSTTVYAFVALIILALPGQVSTGPRRVRR